MSKYTDRILNIMKELEPTSRDKIKYQMKNLSRDIDNELNKFAIHRGVPPVKKLEEPDSHLDKLIALGVDLIVNGKCPFCPKPCDEDHCAYTEKK